MKFLNELHDYDAVDDVYYCRNAEVGIAKNGNAYLKTELVDKTGTESLQRRLTNSMLKCVELLVSTMTP